MGNRNYSLLHFLAKKVSMGAYSQASTPLLYNNKEASAFCCQQQPSIQPEILPLPDINKVDSPQTDNNTGKSSHILSGAVQEEGT